MKTLFENFIEAGASVKQVANGTRVDLGGHTYMFTPEEEHLDSCAGYTIRTIPFALKEALVVVTTKPYWDNNMKCIMTKEVHCFGRIPFEWDQMASYRVYC